MPSLPSLQSFLPILKMVSRTLSQTIPACAIGRHQSTPSSVVPFSSDEVPPSMPSQQFPLYYSQSNLLTPPSYARQASPPSWEHTAAQSLQAVLILPAHLDLSYFHIKIYLLDVETATDFRSQKRPSRDCYKYTVQMPAPTPETRVTDKRCFLLDNPA